MIDSDQTKTKITLKESSGTSESVDIPQKPLVNVSVPLVDMNNDNYVQNQNSPQKYLKKEYNTNYIPELRASISILSQRKEALIQEYKKVQLATVKPPEIALLKAQTQFYNSENTTNQIQDLTSKYIEITRNISYLRSHCRNLEKKIEYQEMLRNELTQDIKTLEKIYDTDNWINSPQFHLTEFDTSTIFKKIEIQKLTDKILYSYKQIQSIQQTKDYEKASIAFDEILQSTKAKSNLNLLGTAEIKDDINQLKIDLQQSEEQLKKFMSSLEKDKKRVKQVEENSYIEERKAADEYQKKIEIFQAKDSKKNSKISQLRSEIEKLQSENILINREIDRLNSLPKPKPFVQNEDEFNDDDISSDQSDDYAAIQANDQLKYTLNQQAIQIKTEINDLNQQYSLLKSSILANQNQKLKQVHDLQDKYQRNYEEIERIILEKKMKPNKEDKRDLNPIDNLFKNISGSIEGIHASFFHET